MESLSETVDAELLRLGLGEAIAGQVLVFGIATRPGDGIEIARSATSDLVSLQGFAQASTRNFWTAAGESGGVNLEIYLLTGEDFAIPETDCFWIGN